MTYAINVFKITDSAKLPRYETKDSACFDIYACLELNSNIKYYDEYNNEKVETLVSDNLSFNIMPKCRYLIPTGLIFDLESGTSIRIYPRSGLALKKGITICNCSGVIDSDYIEPVYLTIYNISNEVFKIKHGDRLCQGELVNNTKVSFNLISKKPKTKTDRQGGFGSTGI